MNSATFKSDILLSYDTDIAFFENDLMITSGIDLVKRKVFKLLISEPGSWNMDKQIGASPNKFTGERNTREIAEILKVYLENGIQPHIQPFVIDVKIVPVNKDSIKIYLYLLFDGQIETTIPYSLDFINGLLYTQYDDKVDKLISDKALKFNDIDDVSQYNKYLDRLAEQYGV